MVTLQEAIEFTKKLRAYNVLTDRKTADKFIDLYHYIFDDVPPCTGCTGDIENAIHKMLVHLKKNQGQNPDELLKETDMSHYRLKPNVRYYSNAMRIYITRYNLTDEVAKMMIAQDPKCVELFETIPDVQAEESPAVTEKKSPVQTEMKFKGKGNGRRKR